MLLDKVSNGFPIYKTEFSGLFYRMKNSFDAQNEEVKALIKEIDNFNQLMQNKLDAIFVLEEILSLVEKGKAISNHKNSSVYYNRKRAYESQNEQVKELIDKISYFSS